MLLVSQVFPPQNGGSGRWFWEIYRRLPRSGVLVAVGEHPQARAFDAAETIACVRLPLAMPEWGLKSLCGLRDYGRLTWRLRTLIRQNGVEALHAARCLPEGWLAWMLRRLTGTPYLVYAHGEDIQSAGQSREQSWMVRRVFRDASVVIANSRNTARLLRQDWRLDAGKVRVLHPGVDTDRFVPAGPDPAVRQRLGWGARPVVLTVGRLQRRKGHDMLIEALSHVRRRVPDVLYAVVGDGAERPRLMELIRRQGLEEHVQMLGEPDDRELVTCYQQCDVFALPNREVDGDIEGFGMVLLEAQACGKPVLAGDSGGTRETMRPVVRGQGTEVGGQRSEVRGQRLEVGGFSIQCSGEEPGATNSDLKAKSQQPTGLIVDCTRAEPLAAAVTELLLDRELRDRMGRAARSWAVERFSWTGLAAEAADIFRGLGRPATRVAVLDRPRVAAEQVRV